MKKLDLCRRRKMSRFNEALQVYKEASRAYDEAKDDG